MLVGTDDCVPVVFMWEETRVPGGNPPVWLGDHMTISGIEPGSQWWEVSALPLRQPDSLIKQELINAIYFFMAVAYLNSTKWNKWHRF